MSFHCIWLFKFTWQGPSGAPLPISLGNQGECEAAPLSAFGLMFTAKITGLGHWDYGVLVDESQCSCLDKNKTAVESFSKGSNITVWAMRFYYSLLIQITFLLSA